MLFLLAFVPVLLLAGAIAQAPGVYLAGIVPALFFWRKGISFGDALFLRRVAFDVMSLWAVFPLFNVYRWLTGELISPSISAFTKSQLPPAVLVVGHFVLFAGIAARRFARPVIEHDVTPGRMLWWVCVGIGGGSLLAPMGRVLLAPEVSLAFCVFSATVLFWLLLEKARGNLQISDEIIEPTFLWSRGVLLLALCISVFVHIFLLVKNCDSFTIGHEGNNMYSEIFGHVGVVGCCVMALLVVRAFLLFWRQSHSRSVVRLAVVALAVAVFANMIFGGLGLAYLNASATISTMFLYVITVWISIAPSSQKNR